MVYCMPERLRRCAERFYPPVAFINYYKEIMEDDFLDFGSKRNKQFIKLKICSNMRKKKCLLQNLFKTIGFSIDNFKHFSDLSAIPILTKACIQRNAALFISDDFKARNLVPSLLRGLRMRRCVFSLIQSPILLGGGKEEAVNMAGVDLRIRILLLPKLLKKIFWGVTIKEIYMNTLRFDSDSLGALLIF